MGTKEALLRSAPRLFADIDPRPVAVDQATGIICLTGVVGIGRGRLWATAFQEGLVVTTINCPGCAWPEVSAGVELDCTADGRPQTPAAPPGHGARLGPMASGSLSRPALDRVALCTNGPRSDPPEVRAANAPRG